MLLLLNPIDRNLLVQKLYQGKQEQYSTAGYTTSDRLTVCHFQVENNCSRDYKCGPEHTR